MGSKIPFRAPQPVANRKYVHFVLWWQRQQQQIIPLLLLLNFTSLSTNPDTFTNVQFETPNPLTNIPTHTNKSYSSYSRISI